MQPKRALGSLVAGLSVALALGGLTGGAAAQSDYCGYLRSQIAALGGSDGDRNREASTQAIYRELAAASDQARALNCQRGFLFFGRGGPPQCPAILSRVDAIQATIANLQRSGTPQRTSFFGAPSLPTQIDRLRQEMAGAGCPPPSATGFGEGGYRTLCVRVCDGYYFPISFGAGQARFREDEKACQAMYPEGQAGLYVQSDPDSDDLVSLDGKKYRDQPFALAYRASYNAACPSPRAAASSNSGATVMPIPVAKPRRAEDPETLANLAGDFEPVVERPPAPSAETVAERRVRLVGPGYLYGVPEDAPPAATISAKLTSGNSATP